MQARVQAPPTILRTLGQVIAYELYSRGVTRHGLRKVDPDFTTVTYLQWKRILADERALEGRGAANMCALVGGTTAHGNHTTPTRAGELLVIGNAARRRPYFWQKGCLFCPEVRLNIFT